MKWLVYGLGESGLCASQALLDRDESVAVADSSSDSDRLGHVAESLGVEARLGAGPGVLKEDFDAIVASPGIRPRDPLLTAAERSGVPIVSEVGLGLDMLRDEVPDLRISAVTGTNGKTTVVDMMRSALVAAGVPHVVAGNSWRALTGCLDEAKKAGTLVLEVSSFQLHYLSEPKFDVAALLNARPDHLNWHTDFQEYVSDKLCVFDGQEPTDLALVSAGDSVGREASGRLVAETIVVGERGTLVEDGRLLLRGRHLVETSELPFVGLHNHENALFAAAAAERLGAKLGSIREGLLGYGLMPHRMQIVGERGGVLYMDDSKATNPAAVAAALASLGNPIVLILGGSEKWTDFSEILPYLSRCRAAVCQGESGPRIARYLRENGTSADVMVVPDLAAAVQSAGQVARQGDTVLLSPGSASFDQFAGYAERGDAFARLSLADSAADAGPRRVAGG